MKFDGLTLHLRSLGIDDPKRLVRYAKRKGWIKRQPKLAVNVAERENRLLRSEMDKAFASCPQPEQPCSPPAAQN